jgi:dolichol-phosphate mannosyltransferase
MMPKLGIVIPAYREEENIVRLCFEISQFVPESKILVVDDSPSDLSVIAIREAALPNVEIVHRKVKSGRGSAVLFGITKILEGDVDFILEIDADFSHPPEQILQLIAKAQENDCDLLIASRYLKESKILGWPISRRLFSFAANNLARICLQVPVKDYTNGYRLYSARAARELIVTCGRLGDGFIILSEILVNLYYRGFKVCEVPTVFVNRVRGVSSLGHREVFSAVLGLIKITKLRRQLSK